MKNIHRINGNIYITNDVEIKMSEEVWYLFGEKILKNKKGDKPKKFCKKIILTDNPDLIKDGVQKIDDEFLEWFVKNTSCEKVETVNVPYFDESGYSYLLIIPKEEPKQETLEEVAERYLKENNVTCLDVLENVTTLDGIPFNQKERIINAFVKWRQEQDNENSWFNEYQEVENYIIKKIGDKFLEATPEKYNTASQATIALLENNWQQKQNKNLYSEEEVYQILSKFRELRLIDFQEWFEQFKKK